MIALTSNEVAALTGLDEKVVRKDIEQGVLVTGTPPRFGQTALLYFMARALFTLDLPTRERRRLHTWIEEAVSAGRSTLDLGPGWVLDLAAVEAIVSEKLRSFEAWRDRLHRGDAVLAGEPVFPGSRLSVRRVGDALRRGVDRSELLEDYPYLTERDLDFAALWATAYPRVGRPRAPISAR